MPERFLVMGDNHGDTESLRRVLEDVADKSFDYAVHVGDFTSAWRESRARETDTRCTGLGADQLAAVEPLLDEFDAQAEHGLVWVYGNQDYFGDLPYELEVGTQVPENGFVTVGGQRFTNDPSRVEADVILVSHMERQSLVDHFTGRAHFCGNSHRGRHLGNRLNAAFLQVTDPETGEQRYGGYFLVELTADGEMDVEMRSIGGLERVACSRHRERGVQFQATGRGCMYCNDQRTLLRELSASAFYGLTADSARRTVPASELIDYAVTLWESPPDGFAADLEAYLADLDDYRYSALTRTAEGTLTVADRSYVY